MDKHTSVMVKEIPNCDFCDVEGKKTKAWCDGRTTFGSWAYMCHHHYLLCGIGLGLGLGQKLIKEK